MVAAIFFSLGVERHEYYAAQRDYTRINAIESIGHTLPADEDDWRLKYPAPLVIWLVNMLNLCEWKWSIPQLLATEQAYPGLLNEIDTVLWQRQLIKEQLKGNQG